MPDGGPGGGGGGVGGRVPARPSAQTAELEGPLSASTARSPGPVAPRAQIPGWSPAPLAPPGRAIGCGSAWRSAGITGWCATFRTRRRASPTPVNYDATPLRLVLAAQNNVVMAGVRAGVAVYRVATQQTYTEVTPLVGPFLAAKFPIAGRFRGLLVGGFDYFARRTELSTGSFDKAYSSPQLAPYVAVVAEAVLAP